MPQSVDALRALVTPPDATQAPDYGYGFRYHSRDPKGLGFLGPLERPDQTGMMSEYSVSQPLNGQDTEMPSMVPTLTRDEVQSILASRGGPLSPAIYQKAAAYAQFRRNAGLPVFALTGEQQNLYPDLPRASIPPARQQPPPMAVSHAQSVDALRRKTGQ